jgi:hypothetical protein
VHSFLIQLPGDGEREPRPRDSGLSQNLAIRYPVRHRFYTQRSQYDRFFHPGGTKKDDTSKLSKFAFPRPDQAAALLQSFQRSNISELPTWRLANSTHWTVSIPEESVEIR